MDQRARLKAATIRARARAIAPKMSEDAAAAALEGLRGRPVRAMAPPRAGAVVAEAMRRFCRDEGLTIGELKRRWPEIVGEKLARLTRPEKLARTPEGLVLTIAAAGSAAPFVQHQERLILDRCALAGGRIARLALRQIAASAAGEFGGGNVRPLARGLSVQEEHALTAGLALVEDKRLKDALARLGRSLAVRG